VGRLRLPEQGVIGDQGPEVSRSPRKNGGEQKCDFRPFGIDPSAPYFGQGRELRLSGILLEFERKGRLEFEGVFPEEAAAEGVDGGHRRPVEVGEGPCERSRMIGTDPLKKGGMPSFGFLPEGLSSGGDKQVVNPPPDLLRGRLGKGDHKDPLDRKSLQDGPEKENGQSGRLSGSGRGLDQVEPRKRPVEKRVFSHQEVPSSVILARRGSQSLRDQRPKAISPGRSRPEKARAVQKGERERGSKKVDRALKGGTREERRSSRALPDAWLQAGLPTGPAFSRNVSAKTREASGSNGRGARRPFRKARKYGRN
jgi:hypothetical protein